jgi:Membrane protease subunits, stomatin/prohibitin homologs
MNRLGVAVIAAVLVLLGLSSVFVVNEGQSALLLQFGRIVRTDYQPGLHVKLPLVQQVVKFDKRILSLDARRSATSLPRRRASTSTST